MANDLAVRKDNIRKYLEAPEFKDQLARALPKHLGPERYLRVVITAMTKNPKLWQCDQASLFNALLTLSELGLEPDGRRAHLIPYGTICQLIIDYKGLVELIMNTGEVSSIHADVVCENDDFVYDRGRIERHGINFKQARGEPYAAYALIRFRDGSEKAEVMTKEDVEAVRARSKAKNSGPWVTDWNEMAKKTVFRRASKWVKLSPEQRDIIEADDDHILLKASKRNVGAEMEKRLNFGGDELPEDEPPADEPPREEKTEVEVITVFCPNENKQVDIDLCPDCKDSKGCPANE